MTKDDRLLVAWKLRRDVHAWISANPDAAMPTISRAFGSHEHEAIRGVVRTLCALGFVRKADCKYLVIREFDQPENAMRDSLRAVGLAAAPALSQANRTRPRREDGTFAPGPVVVLGRRYINRPGKRQAIKNQGGQGACGSWRGGRSSLVAG